MDHSKFIGWLEMDIKIKNLEKVTEGWNLCIEVELNAEECSKFKPELINEVEDYKITLKDNNLYFKRYFSISEPWEDEPLEEVLDGMKDEVEYKVREILGEEG